MTEPVPGIGDRRHTAKQRAAMPRREAPAPRSQAEPLGNGRID
ncbi:MAG: hypothetical protein ABSD53_08045 [Terriglobales bacterium]